jgi:hypothetical protein
MKKVVVFGLMVLLLVFTVVAQSSDDTDAIDAFEKDKTPENLAKINNPNVGQFNKLENAQDKKTYLKDNYRDDFAGEYFKK